MLQKKQNKKIFLQNTISDEINQLLEDHIFVEKNIIGKLLIFPHEFNSCLEIIKHSDFFNSFCADIFKTMTKLYTEHKDINVLNLIPYFSATKLTSLMTNVTDNSDSRKLAITIKNNKLIRDIINSSDQQKQLIFSKEPIEKIISSLKNNFDEIQSSVISKTKNDSKTIIKNLIKEKETFSGKKLIGFPTFDNLDQFVDGLIVPHIWIIGGAPGTGKTFFTLQLVEKILKNNAKIVIFSTENTAIRTMLRLIGCHTGIYEIEMLKGKLTQEEIENIQLIEEELKNKTLFIYDNVFDTDEIKIKLNQHVKKDGVNVFVVDYIQLLNTQEDNYEQMRIVASELQKISKENNCALIAVSQISNEGMKTRNFFGMHFKGAGEIGAIADVAIELKRSTKDMNAIAAIIKKVRHNIPGTIEFNMFTEENRKNKNYIEPKFI